MPGLVPDATGQPGGTGMADPFGMMNSLMEFQNRANQNKQFQTQFMAKQAFGEIMAHAPSVEEGLNAAQANPLIAGFAQEGMLTAREIALRQAQTTQTGQTTANLKMQMGKDGFESAMSTGLMAAADPANWNKYFDAGMKGVDPSVMGYVKPKMDAIRQAIGAKIQGLNMNDPTQLAQAQKAITSLVTGAAATAGVGHDQIANFMPGTTLTPQGMPMQVPSPQQQTTGAFPTPISVPQPAQAAAQPVVVTNSASGEKYPVDLSNTTPYLVKDATGKPAVSMQGRNAVDEQRYGKMDEELKAQHAGPELAAYNGDRGMINSLAQMQGAADDLTAKGGFNTPGLFGTARAAISNAMETVENITGTKFTGDAALPAENADAQVINKWSHALPFQLKKALDAGNQRGLGVLMEAAAAVPSMENTPLAFKVLTTGLKALANWDIGKYEYKEGYLNDPRNTAGTLLGSDLAYGKISSPLSEATRELGKIGIVLDGSQIKFADDAHLLQAYETGLFGKRKAGPDAPDGPAEKAMDEMYKSVLKH